MSWKNNCASGGGGMFRGTTQGLRSEATSGGDNRDGAMGPPALPDTAQSQGQTHSLLCPLSPLSAQPVSSGPVLTDPLPGGGPPSHQQRWK